MRPGLDQTPDPFVCRARHGVIDAVEVDPEPLFESFLGEQNPVMKLGTCRSAGQHQTKLFAGQVNR